QQHPASVLCDGSDLETAPDLSLHGLTMLNDPIFQPLTINGVTFKNRVFRSSLGGRVDYYDGSMSEARIAWDRRFARGGVGAIISSNAGIRPDGFAVPGYASIHDDRTIPSWRALIRAIHEYD